MKKLLLSVILIIAIGMTACSPSKSEKNRIVTEYINHTEIFKCTIAYYNADVKYENAYVVFADDKYEAARLIDNILRKENIDENSIVMRYMESIYITARQHYPYNK